MIKKPSLPSNSYKACFSHALFPSTEEHGEQFLLSVFNYFAAIPVCQCLKAFKIALQVRNVKISYYATQSYLLSIVPKSYAWDSIPSFIIDFLLLVCFFIKQLPWTDSCVFLSSKPDGIPTEKYSHTQSISWLLPELWRKVWNKNILENHCWIVL